VTLLEVKNKTIISHGFMTNFIVLHVAKILQRTGRKTKRTRNNPELIRHY